MFIIMTARVHYHDNGVFCHIFLMMIASRLSGISSDGIESQVKSLREELDAKEKAAVKLATEVCNFSSTFSFLIV